MVEVYVRFCHKNIHGAVDDVLAYNIKKNEFESQLLSYVYFRTNAFGKSINALIPLLWVPLLFLFLFFIKMDVALNDSHILTRYSTKKQIK